MCLFVCFLECVFDVFCCNVLWAQCLRVAPPIAVFVSMMCVAKLSRCWPLKVLTRKTSM